MDAGIAAALAAGRSIIVPSAQRAAALRWNWARVQRDQDRAVWASPDILTWEAWLESQWRQAQRQGRVAPATRCLNLSQQLQLWEQVLRGLESGYGAADDLALHAPALMRAAARASQWMLPLSRLAVSEEERLLAQALQAVQRYGEEQDCVVLPLATPAQLAAFVAGPAPLIVGEPRLTELQRQLGVLCWPEAVLLGGASATGPASVAPHLRHVVAVDLEQELAACGQWCREQLLQDPSRRLLVISATGDPSLRAQGVMLARALHAGTGVVAQDAAQSGLLAVEGGEPLAQQALVADALGALRLWRAQIEFQDLSRTLRSPYMGLGTHAAMHELEQTLAELGLARWAEPALHDVLAGLAAGGAAAPLALWLQEGRMWRASAVAPLTQWAQRFSSALSGAGFARREALDSRDAQRLVRWNQLLDEFAALDAVRDPMRLEPALQCLLQLVGQARHAPESGDAPVTLTSDRGAPLARYDGIWVLGLAEQRWPEPPRPDPYVPLAAQRRCGWEEAGAQQRLQQAEWSLAQWRGCTASLVLSYPAQEGDVRHRPSSLLSQSAGLAWEAAMLDGVPIEPFCTAPVVADRRLPALAGNAGRLSRGLQRLRLQQACAFRGQAEIRLAAKPAPLIGDGIHPALRGVLLHGVLEGMWRELGGQKALQILDEAGRRALFNRHWDLQVNAHAATKGLHHGARIMAREQQRAGRLILRTLAMEAQRPPFRVLAGEQQLRLPTPFGAMSLRVDRVDEDDAGRHWLIDYKSGAPETLKLAQGEAQPVQLALYEQALAANGQAVQGAALLSLSPAQAGFRGAAAEPSGWPGTWQLVEDWDARRLQWRAALDALLDEHAAGHAQVAPLRDACRVCHLAALCRRQELAADAAEADAEDGDD
jgi:probable DNA repair protein